MKLPDIKKLKVDGKKVLLRVDFNVPLSGGKVASDERIKASVETINWLSNNGAIVTICSHLGRPDGKKVKKLSLKPVVPVLSKIINKKVTFVTDLWGLRRNKKIDSARPGDVILLENIRFDAREEQNDAEFSEKLAEGFDLYVNDAFSASHRAHASTVGVTKYLKSYAGFGLQKEIEVLTNWFNKPKKPFLAIIGGAKISTKIEIIEKLLSKVDILIIGGAMANTFFVAEGYDVGLSFFEEDYVDVAERISRDAFDKGVELIIPTDVNVSRKIGAKKIESKDLEEIEKGEIVVDIGPKSLAKFSEPIKFAGTIFWNGPVGISEYPASVVGTNAIANIVSEAKGKSIIGGGDTLAAVAKSNLNFDFVSTGGGATLELIAGHKLPGIEALGKK